MGNYGIFRIMGKAGFTSSTEALLEQPPGIQEKVLNKETCLGSCLTDVKGADYAFSGQAGVTDKSRSSKHFCKPRIPFLVPLVYP